jgi:ectoine hydroxylase-related dioxygenase (phytanoyl-CoA dioxygenase family)
MPEPLPSDVRRAAWERDGFFIVRGFGSTELCSAMHARAVELAREAKGTGAADGSVIQAETQPNPLARHAEDSVSKIFKLHRDQRVFRSFIEAESVLDLAVELIGDDLDCFLSQFIFKNPGAIGQPWHQDSFYFPFDRAPQVGIWLAVTEATLENGCLHVMPGSHREPVHTHVRDRREHANLGYVEIVDFDMSASIPVEMDPGDLLVFHSHLMHRSTDNESARLRAAMVYHLAAAGTLDRAPNPAPINDWLPVRRRIETQIEIAAPIERVSRALADGSRYADWNPYLVQIDGAIESGTEIVAHARFADGREQAMPVQVVAVEPTRMHWEGGLPDRSLFKGDHFFELDDLGATTRLRHFENFTGRLVDRIVVAGGDAIRANFERMNAALRTHCESD